MQFIAIGGNSYGSEEIFRLKIAAAAFALAAPALLAAPAFAADLPQPPIAEKTQWMETRHGEAVTDDYRWLPEKSNPAVIE